MSLWQMVSSYIPRTEAEPYHCYSFKNATETFFSREWQEQIFLTKTWFFPETQQLPKQRYLFINLARQCAVLSPHKIKNWKIKITNIHWHAVPIWPLGMLLTLQSWIVQSWQYMNSWTSFGERVALVSIWKKYFIFHLCGLLVVSPLTMPVSTIYATSSRHLHQGNSFT